jgi:uncharacterized protein DUF4154
MPCTSDSKQEAHTTGRKLCSTLLLLISVFCWASSLWGQVPRAEESQVKAAFLYNFGKFVKWPNGQSPQSFTICVLGKDPFGPELDSIVSGELVDGRAVTVRRIAGTQDAAGCRILFISASEQNRLGLILFAVSKLPVLTVSDMPEFIERGGMIQFGLVGGRVRFDVNLGSTENSGLAMSSELLKVAQRVKRKGD